MRIEKDTDFLFSQPGAKRWLMRKRVPRSNALIPMGTDPKSTSYFRSLDPQVLKLTEFLATRLTDEFPTDVLPSGFAGPSSVPGTFYNLLNVSGYGMDPLPIPVSNNKSLCDANGIATAIRPADLPIFKELMRLFFGHVAPANLHIRRAASTGFPFFTSDNQYKKIATLKALHEADNFLKLMTTSDSALREGLETYHSILAYAIQERQQPNSISLSEGKFSSKARTAPTEEEARSGSYDGKTIASMVVRDEHGTEIPNHFAMRRRDVFGGNGVINYFLTAIFGCFREVYLNRFAFTYKTRGREDKQQRAARYSYVVGSDVKTMDKMIPEWFTDMVFAELAANYLDERVVELMRRKFKAPYVVPQPWQETSPDYNPVFGGSPLKAENCKQHVGLPSGIAFNPDFGKLWMTFVYLVLYRDCGAINGPADIEPLLRGLNPEHALQDMSDDAVFLTNSATVAKRLSEPSSPYAVLEVEKPVIYLGDVYCDVSGRKEVYPNPITFIVNELCREDSIDAIGKGAVAWAEGKLARFQVYSPNPIFRDLNAIYNEATRKYLGVDTMLLARSLAKQQRFSDVDALVRLSPQVIHYKVDPKDVSPEVLDEVVATIPARDFFNKIKHLFKVPTTEMEPA